MRKQPNKYRNQLGPTATSYMVLVGIITAIAGSAFVCMKNQHLAQEDRKRYLEKEIKRHGEESARLKLNIQVHLGGGAGANLYRALSKGQSQLVRIPPGALTTISPAPMPGEMNLLPEEGVAHE